MYKIGSVRLFLSLIHILAIGALQAIQAAGRTVNKDIYLVGVDALDAAKNEVANGNMTGTVLNDANGQASKAVECKMCIRDSLKVAEADMGRVIGKQGRIAKAIRVVMRAAAVRQGEKVIVEID